MNGLQERPAWQKIAAYRPKIAGFNGEMLAHYYGASIEALVHSRFVALIWLLLNKVYAISALSCAVAIALWDLIVQLTC